MIGNVRHWVKDHVDASSLLYEVLSSIDRRDMVGVRRAISIRWNKDSTFEQSELDLASGCPASIIELVIRNFHPQSALDVGCGTGKTVEYFRNRGVDCVGVEGSAAAIAASPVTTHLIQADLRFPLDLKRQFDVVWSYEVAEHIHPEFTDAFVDSLVRHGKVLVMSAARPGQRGAGHFNLQPQEYWIEKLARRNFVHNPELSKEIQALPEEFSQNFMVFSCRNSGN